MINLTIDNKDIQVSEGTSLIEAARINGVNIPSLCYKKGIPHYSSCMVCVVKDLGSAKFIPSCSANAEEGMNIDASGDEVIALRKEALSLLLSEHRAECEAPCKVVCPEGLNIPLMNRYIMNNDLASAAELIYLELNDPETICDTCPGYCERACRRKMIDSPIAIRRLIKAIAVLAKTKEVGPFDNSHKGSYRRLDKKTAKRFNSTIGKILENEKKEWLKECPENISRYKEAESISECISESSNCMHCDCRALENCTLRDLCEELNIKNPKRSRDGHPIEKKINSQNGLIFENSKCIKCGLCVRAVIDETNNPSLCFTGRGFMTLISQPLTHDFKSILKNGPDEVIKVCPTGALSKKC